jgi:hypothetical protein
MTHARAEELGAAQPPEAAAPRVVRGLSDRRAAVSAMTGDVKLLLVTSGLVFVLGLGWLAVGPSKKPYPAVLGYVDPGPPTAAQAAGLRHPPFKLPWWK